MSGSTLPVGSSATSSSGRPITARAIATRCCSPPDRVGGRALARSARPTQASISRTGVSRSSSATPGDPERQRDIVVGRQMRDQPEFLEDDADPAAEAGQPAARHGDDILVEQADHAAARPQRQIEQLQQRRLAGAGRAGEEIEAARLQREGQVRQGLGAGAVAQADIVELDDRASRAQDPPSPSEAKPSHGRRFALQARLICEGPQSLARAGPRRA